MSKTICIDGLEIELTKKRIKRMNMRIKEPDGRIAISAPYGTPDASVVDFVRSKRRWIDKNVELIKKKTALSSEKAALFMLINLRHINHHKDEWSRWFRLQQY